MSFAGRKLRHLSLAKPEPALGIFAPSPRHARRPPCVFVSPRHPSHHRPWSLRLERPRFLIYQAKLAFDFRTEGGGIGARHRFLNSLLISNTRNAHRIGTSGRLRSIVPISSRADRRTGPAGTASTRAARGRNPPSPPHKPMLAPSPALLGRAAELHRIWRVRPLHHHALEEIAAERTVCNAEPLVKCERFGVRVSALSRYQRYGFHQKAVRESETRTHTSTLGAEIEGQIRLINAESGPSETEVPRP